MQEVNHDYQKKKSIPDIKRKTFSKKQRIEISLKTNDNCCYCGEDLKSSFHVAHIIPFIQLKAKGIQDDDSSNYMASCPQCNRFERGGGLEFFRDAIMEQTKTAMRDSVNYRFALKYKQIEETPNPIIFYFERLKIEEFIKFNNYSFSIDEILEEYEKFIDFTYVSHSFKKVFEKFSDIFTRS